MMRLFAFSLLSLILFVACNKATKKESTSLMDSNKSDSSMDSKAFRSALPKHTQVFGLSIYATPKVSDSKIDHAARIFAGYLDNDDDGEVDNKALLDKMLEAKATIIMWSDQKDMEMAWKYLNNRETQDLGAEETRPNWHLSAEGKSEGFDGSLEEILHLISHVGYASVYPKIFGERKGSAIADAMDKARGGYFEKIPQKYPSNAWYTYDDTSCDYGCMVTEYFYWGLTSLLGGQGYVGRLDQIKTEWRLNTKEKFEQQDKPLLKLFTNPLYKIPKRLPDGQYSNSQNIKKVY